MFGQAVQVSNAMRWTEGALMPALCGCRACDTTHMIAAPRLGLCEECGAELTVLHSTAAQTAADIKAADALAA